MDEISHNLNFTYIVKEPADGLWGVKQQNGKWNGLIRQIVDEEVFMASAAMAISAERLDVVNFSIPIILEPYRFMYRRPTEVSRAALFFLPLTPFVWLCIGITTVLMCPVLWLIHRASYVYTYNDTVNTFGLFNASNCFIYCYGAILCQGGPTLPGAESGCI